MTKIEKNLQKDLRHSGADADVLFHRLEKICDGLVYISEIDSPVTAFRAEVESGKSSTLREQIGIADSEAVVRELDFDSFFPRLTTRKDWHGEREAARTKKFLDLRKLIEENLHESKVFRIGDIHVRFVAAGLAGDGRAVGVTMLALET